MEWIEVKHQKPPERTEVLILGKNGRQLCEMDSQCWNHAEPTHWAELPENPVTSDEEMEDKISHIWEMVYGQHLYPHEGLNKFAELLENDVPDEVRDDLFKAAWEKARGRYPKMLVTGSASEFEEIARVAFKEYFRIILGEIIF